MDATDDFASARRAYRVAPFPERVNDHRDKDTAVIEDEVSESVIETD